MVDGVDRSRGQVMDRLAERIGFRYRARPPAALAAVIILAGFALMALVMIGLGFALTHGGFSAPVRRWDERVNEWFVTQRTTALNSVTLVGSSIAMTASVIAVTVVSSIVLAIRRWWADMTFLITAVALEASVFLVTTLVIARPRPTVPRLDVSPPTSSFPSGHTAAAIALYVGLAIIVGRHVQNVVVRSLVWALAILVPCFVGVSRLYRGMHHPTDVLGSIPLGVAALLVASLAIYSAVEARACRERPRVVEESHPTAVEKVAS